MDERKEKKKHIIFLITAGALFLAAAYLILCASVKTDRILPNTTVNKVSLGGMTLPDAAGALEADTDARRKNAVLTVTADGTSYTLDIGSLLELDCKAIAAQSLSDSQKGFLLRGFCWLRNAILGSQTMALPSIKDLDALHNRIADAGLLEISSTDNWSLPSEQQEPSRMKPPLPDRFLTPSKPEIMAARSPARRLPESWNQRISNRSTRRCTPNP